jgi:hypothetical protein
MIKPGITLILSLVLYEAMKMASFTSTSAFANDDLCAMDRQRYRIVKRSYTQPQCSQSEHFMAWQAYQHFCHESSLRPI